VEYRNTRGYAKAIADYDELIAAHPDDAVFWTDRGATYLESHQNERALLDYDQAVKLAGQYAWPWASRCWARGVSGQLQQALADCNDALRIDPDDVSSTAESAFANRGVVRLKLKDYQAAISDFDAALKNDPHLARALYGRGIVRKKQGDATGGEADMAAAISVWPDIVGEFDRWGLSDAP
jgi:tetratricopeptide (TPR) repeat protein